MVGLALGLGAVAVAKHTAEAREQARREEAERLERERIAEEQRRIRQAKKDKERKQRNKRIKAFFFNKKNLALEFATSDLVGDNVDSVVEEMLNNGIADRDIKLGNAKLVHELNCIGVGTIRGTKAWHRNANHLLAAHAHHICREAGSQEGQGGIESATDAEHYRLCMRMLPTFG